MLSDEEYRKLARKIKGASLLALPQSAIKILELSKDPENGPPELSAAISNDLGLTSQILRFVNSSYFGFRNRITTIQSALSLVYGKTIKNFVLWNAVFALLPNPKCGPFALRKICQDSLRRGMFAKVVASYLEGIDPETTFLSAMFQDMALPILAQAWPVEYAGILTRRAQERRRLSELELETFGWTHADAGAYLVDEWGFGDEFAASIEQHIEPNFGAMATPEQRRNAVVAVSSFLPSVLDETWTEAEAFWGGYFRLHCKGMPFPDAIFDEVDRQLREMIAIARLEQVPKSLVEFHRQYVAAMG